MKKIGFALFSFLIVLRSFAQINTPKGSVVPFNSNLNYGGNGTLPSGLPTGGVYGKSQDAANAYLEWKASYIEKCGNGYRVKSDDPTFSLSEGIGSGMLLAAYAADKSLFDGLYAYYQANLDANGLMYWGIDGCSNANGIGSATDADLDVAFALLIAKTQWPNFTSPYAYGTEANTLLEKIKQYELSPSGQVTNGDNAGLSDACRNISYQSPAYYKTFAFTNAGNAASWNNAVTAAYQLISANADPTTGLVSDWSDQNGVANKCNPSGLAYPATDGYGYDACRATLRLAMDVLWNNDPTAGGILQKIVNYLNARGISSIGGPLKKDGTSNIGWAHNAAFVSTFAVAAMHSSSQGLLNALYTETKNVKDPIQNSSPSGYYGNTLRCLSLFMMTGNFWKFGTTSNQEINLLQDTVNVATKSTYDFRYTQIASANPAGKTVTFTIENQGFATLTLGPSPIVSLSCDSHFVVSAQPARTSLGLAETTTFSVSFRPAAPGLKTCTLTVQNNDADESPYTVYLKGIGSRGATSPSMTVLDTLNVIASNSLFNLGSFTLGNTGYRLIKIKNTGDAPLNITSMVVSGSGFSLLDPNGADTLKVPAGGSKLITIGYVSNTATTNASGTFTFSTDDDGSPSFTLQLRASATACSLNPSTKVLWDFDGNKNVVQPFSPNGQWNTAFPNAFKNGTNPSPTIARYGRPKSGDNDVIRLYACGAKTTFTAWPPSASELPSFAFNLDNATIRMLVYSPAAGIEIRVSPKKPDSSATLASPKWVPIFPDFSSDVIKTTTKANQWEQIIFDMAKIVNNGLGAEVKAVDILIDPSRKYASLAKSDTTKRIFYLDRIMYANSPCLADASGILDDFDTHINLTLNHDVASLAAPVSNPVSGTGNTSKNVAKFTKSANAVPFSDAVLYNGCANKISLATKKYISLLVYAPVAGESIQLALKIPDGPDADALPDNAMTATQIIPKANTWVRLYFDFSSISATDIPNVFGLELAIDPSANPTSGIYYFDDIRLESTLTCLSAIATSGILNDFDANRNLDLAYLPQGTYVDTAANPLSVNNNSKGVARFIRAIDGNPTTAGNQADILRFKACGKKIDLAKGKSVISVQVLVPQDSTLVKMSLVRADGSTLSTRLLPAQAANTWETLRFDFTDYIGDTTAAFLEVVMDPLNQHVNSIASRTYYVDNIMYATTPLLSLYQDTVPFLNGDTLDFGSITLGDSISLDVTLANHGGTSLVLSGKDKKTLKLSGSDSVNFSQMTTPQFVTTLPKASFTVFTLQFKPLSGGEKLSVLTIPSNDPDHPNYVLYLKGTALCPFIASPMVPEPKVHYCRNDTADTLKATASLGNSLLWYADSVGGSSKDSLAIPVTSLASKSVVYVAQGAKNCESKRVAIEIVVDARPVVHISGDGKVCDGTYTTLRAMGASSYVWDKGPTTDTNRVRPLASTRYLVKGTDSLTTCSDTASILVKIKPKPAVSVTGLDTLCKDSATVLQAKGATSYAWVNGPISDTFFVRPSQSMRFVVQGTDSVTACSDTASIGITVKKCPLPLPRPALSLLWVCEGERGVLVAQGINGGVLSWYTQAQGGVAVGSGDTVVISALTQDTDFYVQDSLHEVASDRVKVSVKVSNQKLTIQGTTIQCPSQLQGLSYRITPSYSGLQYTWKVTGDATVQGADDAATLTMASDSLVTLSVVPISTNGTSCQNQGTLNVAKMPQFSTSARLVLSKDTVCEGQALTATVLSVPSGMSLAWTVPTVASIRFPSNQDSTQAIITLGASGNTISVRPASHCPDTARSLVAEVTLIPKPQVNAGEDQTHNLLSEVFQLSGTVLNGETGLVYVPQWSNVQGTSLISTPDSFQTKVLAKEPVTDYVFTVAALGGSCTGTDTVRVFFKWNIKPPLIFSPNEDGKNDVWLIPELAYFPDVEVEVFNQWGTVVYTKQKMYHTDPWNGKSNSGHLLPVATYYYILRLNQGGYKDLSGSVTIVR